MIKRTFHSVRKLGSRPWWKMGQDWAHPKLNRTTIAATAAVVVPLVAVGVWAFFKQERTLIKLRRANEYLAEQIAKKGARVKNRKDSPRLHAIDETEGRSDAIRLHEVAAESA